MPHISTPTKIAATQSHAATPGAQIEVRFSGSTSPEREAVVRTVIEEKGAILVPPYEHPDIVLGQGTVALELQAQVREMLGSRPELSVHHHHHQKNIDEEHDLDLDAVITPVGGGGLNSGVATWFADSYTEGKTSKKTLVFGAEPSFQGADDCRRSLANLHAGDDQRITTVSSLTIADGLRTPVGAIPWSVISDASKVRGVYAVTEDQIRAAWRLVLERMKMVVEPSAVVPLAVVLFNEEFRKLVQDEAGEKGWDIGVVFSGGNTSVEVIAQLLATK